MEAGEKYLYIKVLGSLELKAFPNKDKKKATEPDFKGDGIAVWINIKKEKPQEAKVKGVNFHSTL